MRTTIPASAFRAAFIRVIHRHSSPECDCFFFVPLQRISGNLSSTHVI